LAEEPDVQQRNENVQKQLAQLVVEMEWYTKRTVTRLRMTAAKHRLADRVIRKVRRRRNWFGAFRHTPVQRKFLSMMIRLAIAAHPNSANLATRIARYYSNNYVYEWCHSPITRPLSVLARDMILRGADSTFGDTPEAATLAYVVAHHEEQRVTNVSSYSELCTRHLALQRVNFFRDAYLDERQQLKLDIHIPRTVESDTNRAKPPAPEESSS